MKSLIMFIRLDVLIRNIFDIRFFNMDFDISIPNTGHNEGLNDQIIPFKNASKYACRIDKEFRK